MDVHSLLALLRWTTKDKKRGVNVLFWYIYSTVIATDFSKMIDCDTP